MKKIFRIASYDFKRLMINPFTIVSLIVILVICMLTGVIYKIEPTPEYSASVSGGTARAIYSNFTSGTDTDSKSNLDDILASAKKYLTVQKQSNEGTEKQTLDYINTTFSKIKTEIEKYHSTGSCTYTENQDISEISETATEFSNFIEEYSSLNAFESKLIFTNEDFETLQNIAKYFSEITNSNKAISQILTDIYNHISYFDSLGNITENATPWTVDTEKIELCQTNYISRASEKLQAILTEMETLYNSSSTANTEAVNNMKNLITNYKLTCESAENAVKLELELALNNHFGSLKNLYHYQEVKNEDAEIELTLCSYFLKDDGVYYTQYQQPLNFNTASYQVSLYDHAYFVVSIIGFFTILFGIFCTYKLFGLDRKNGKMDIVLSQNVSFGQVFVGKFLAIILCTSCVLGIFSVASLIWGALMYPSLANGILAVFNLSTVYTISPFLFFVIKVIGIELQVIFYSTITLFLMNISRKFNLCFGIAVGLFVIATICNIFLNGSLVYCLFPFIHADLTSFLGGATMQTGFLKTSLYAYGSFYISLIYYLVVVGLLFNFTKQLFKKN